MACNLDANFDALRAAWGEVTSRKSEKNWCVFNFENDGKTLKVKGCGDGGFQEMADTLDEAEVSFGAFLVKGIDDRGSTVSERDKYVAFTWIGENVPVMKKARVSVQKKDVLKIFDGCGMNIEIIDRESFTPKWVTSILLKAGGAHKPTYYKFGPNEADKVMLEFYEGGDQ
jgi:Cofilin/tropomyosin-type actin-binding protein